MIHSLVLGGVELKLAEQGEVVRREMGIGTADNLALFQPVWAGGAQQTNRVEKVSTIENVVNDSLEIVSVVGKLHGNAAVCVLQVELVYQLWFAKRRAHAWPHRCTESCQETLIAMVL